MVWVLIDYYFKNTIHQIIIPVTFIAINYLSYKFKIFKSIEREEDNHLGTVYFSIAITAIYTVAFFIPELYIYTGISTFCLTFGDGFASFIGSSIKSMKIKDSKSIVGFIACFVLRGLCEITKPLVLVYPSFIIDCIAALYFSAISVSFSHSINLSHEFDGMFVSPDDNVIDGLEVVNIPIEDIGTEAEGKAKAKASAEAYAEPKA